MKKIKISQAVIVEGKYDKIKLSSFMDALIIPTNGFRIFKDKPTADLIRHYAATTGIIILTDSDSSGFKIRGYIKGICPEGKIINLYIPDIFGKEKRKTLPSKEGKIGVEGIDTDILLKKFSQAGIIGDVAEKKNCLTKTDFYELGITGHPDSSSFRKKIAKKLSLPELITANALLDIVNTIYDRESFLSILSEMEGEF